jgi:hypothetical protein
MDNTGRDALKSISRVAAKAVQKSADVLSQIASVNSRDPVLTDPPRLLSKSADTLVPHPRCTKSSPMFSTSENREWRCHRHNYKTDL